MSTSETNAQKTAEITATHGASATENTTSAEVPKAPKEIEAVKYPKNYSPEFIDEIQKWGMPTIRAGIIPWNFHEKEGMKFLLVHEARVKKDGVWQDGDGGWNLPCG